MCRINRPISDLKSGVHRGVESPERVYLFYVLAGVVEIDIKMCKTLVTCSTG